MATDLDASCVLMLAAANSVHTMRWANAYAARGLDVYLLSQHDPLDGYAPDVHLVDLPHRSPVGYLTNGPAFRRLVRQIRPDVINAHYASGYGIVSRWSGDVPVVLNVWGSDVFEFPRRSRLHKLLLLANLRHATCVVSTSEAMARETRRLGRNLPDVHVVPFGVQTDVFSPAEKSHRDDLPVVIGTVKALEHLYGIDTLIRSFAEVFRMCDHLDVRLRIVGEGSQEGGLKTLAAALDIHDRVEFIGAIQHSEVPDHLRGLDIFAALSREESFGVAAIEASSCGLPLVVSNVGGLPEVVVNGTTGAVVPPDDPHSAAVALADLVRSHSRRRTWGAAGRALVIQRYEWETSVGRMLEILLSATRRENTFGVPR